ncbi:MAG: hypothetical protein SGARI_007619, partial [Bacillariaceae sp.]
MMFRQAATLLLLALTGTKACTNYEGEKISSILELPQFEATPEEINESTIVVIGKLSATFLQIAAFDLNVTEPVSDPRMRVKQSASFEESPVAILEKALAETSLTTRRFSIIANAFEQEEMRIAAATAAAQIGAFLADKLSFDENLYTVMSNF